MGCSTTRTRSQTAISLDRLKSRQLRLLNSPSQEQATSILVTQPIARPPVKRQKLQSPTARQREQLKIGTQLPRRRILPWQQPQCSPSDGTPELTVCSSSMTKPRMTAVILVQ